MSATGWDASAAVLHCDNTFFEALLAADAEALDRVLADDFVIVDVMAGGVNTRDDFLVAIQGGAVQFTVIDRAPSQVAVRFRHGIAIAIGRTRMSVRSAFGESTVLSRYTHIFENASGSWRLVSAQGTRISRETADTDFGEPVSIVPFGGDRRALIELFRLAEDSERRLDDYIDAGCVWVALRGSTEVIGHIQVIERDHGQTWEVANTAVAAPHRGAGVGRRLLDHVVKQASAGGARRVQLATATADIGNLRFYQRCGFRLGRVVHDAFVPRTGYPAGTASHGIAVRDQVWFERVI